MVDIPDDGHTRLGPSSSIVELADVVGQVAERLPGARLTRNAVGNLHIVTPVNDGWRYEGFIDLIDPMASLDDGEEIRSGTDTDH
jgi:hypothetical protein